MSQDSNGSEQGDLRSDSAPERSEEAASGPMGRWQSLTPQQKKIAFAAVVLNMIIASFTWRDLRRRPPALVRGPKLFWRVWSMLNTTGSVAYWVVGRRRPSTSTSITVT